MMTPIGLSPLRCRQFVVRLRVRKDKAPREAYEADIVSAAGLRILCFVAANGTVSERTSRRHVTGTPLPKVRSAVASRDKGALVKYSRCGCNESHDVSERVLRKRPCSSHRRMATMLAVIFFRDGGAVQEPPQCFWQKSA
jgi:hypothetical protein